MANKIVTVLEADGTTETDILSLDAGRQAAAASKSVTLSSEDFAVVDGIETKLDSLITAQVTVGTAGSPSTQVLSVQGVASGTSIPVAATLTAETTKVIGTVRTASGGMAAGSLATGAGVDGWDLTQGAIADAASATGSISAKLRGIATALGITALDLGSGTGGSRTLRWFHDTAQWIGGWGAVTSATQRIISAPNGFSARVSVTRPSDTTTYAAGDVVGVTGGGTGTITFPNMGFGAGDVMITSLRFQRNATAVIASEAGYKLHLFNVTQPGAQADNAVFDVAAGDQASYMGFISIPTPTDLGSTLHSQVDGINKQVTLAGTSLFGVLTTDGAYQPVSAAVHVVELHTVAV